MASWVHKQVYLFLKLRVMSIFVFAGSAQFMAVGMIKTGAISLTNPYIVAGLMTIATVLVTKKSIISIVLGIGSLIVFRHFF